MGDVATTGRKKLTRKQRAFVDEYLIDLNATQAAIRAGYSKDTAGAIGSQNLAKLEIKAAIEAACADRSRRTEITQEWVLERLKVEAERESDGASHSARVAAIKLLGQHLGMFGEREKPALEAVLELIRSTLGEDACRRIGEHLRGQGGGGGG